LNIFEMETCWNCDNSYFVDDKNVYYGLTKIPGADSKTFRLLNLDTIDAEDKNRKYLKVNQFNKPLD
jgi:hypothetical protein